jgi:hypothetical protein
MRFGSMLTYPQCFLKMMRSIEKDVYKQSKLVY